jgi:hypothetical protein
MVRTFVVAAVLAAALSGLIATPTLALESSCLWDNLAPAKQAELSANYQAFGAGYLDELRPTQAEADVWAANCGVTDANAGIARGLIGRAVILNATPGILARDYGVTPEALANAWNGIDPTVLETARREATLAAGDRGVDPIASEAVVMHMLKALNLSQEGPLLVVLYVMTTLVGDFVVAP